MIGLNIVIAAILAFTAAMCAVASVVLRGKWPMAWLAAALICGSAQTLVMTFGAGTPVELLAKATLAPIAYIFAGLGIKAMNPKATKASLPVLMAVGALTLLAVALQVADAAFFQFAVVTQLACTLAATQAAVWMSQQMRHNLLDLLVTGGLVVIAAFSAVRIPLLLFYYGADVSFTEFRLSALETVLLSVSGLLVPPVIFLLIARNIADTIRTFQHQSERDGLTGLLNRRAFDATAESSMGLGGAVVFCDIDHFKQVNDRYGHQAGDDVIRTFAALLARTGHHAGRIGGEEFAILLPGKTIGEARDLAEMIRARFHETAHTGLTVEHRLSASFGVAVHGIGEPLRAAFTRADSALYQAKETGRNRVVLFGDPAPLALPRRGRHAA
jgi:diguanylate cyclase (GGDEF)-like protein